MAKSSHVRITSWKLSRVGKRLLQLKATTTELGSDVPAFGDGDVVFVPIGRLDALRRYADGGMRLFVSPANAYYSLSNPPEEVLQIIDDMLADMP